MKWSKDNDLCLVALIMDGKEYSEIAEAMGCTDKSASSRLFLLGVKKKHVIGAALKGTAPEEFLNNTPYYVELKRQEALKEETLFSLKSAVQKSFPVHVIEKNEEIIIAGSFRRDEKNEFIGWLNNQFKEVRV